MDKNQTDLTIYLLIDCSASMIGEPLEAVKQGIRAFVLEWREDFRAAEAACVSVIFFDSVPRRVTPLTRIEHWNEPKLFPGGTSCLEKAFSYVTQCIRDDKERIEASFCPIVLLFTDGKVLDSWKEAARKLIEEEKASLFVCAAGARARTDLFADAAKSVISLNTLSYGDFAQCFIWDSSKS